jgi:Spy/CpxP family protein refolding chaperone
LKGIEMKYSLGVILIATLLFFSNDGFAQRRRAPRTMDGPRPERLEKFRKMRLIEILKLGEEDAVRFFAKHSAHENAQRDLLKSRNAALDQIEESMREKGDSKNVQKLTADVESIDQKMFAERQRFHEDLQKVLTPEQFGKFLVFERNFGRQVKDALQEMHEGHREDGRF